MLESSHGTAVYRGTIPDRILVVECKARRTRKIFQISLPGREGREDSLIKIMQVYNYRSKASVATCGTQFSPVH